MFRAAIFDLDGVLVDSLQLILDSFFEVCRRHGIPLERSFIISQFGTHSRDKFENILAAAGMQGNVEELVEERYSEVLKKVSEVRPQPGAIGLLSDLKNRGVKIGIATGTRRKIMELKLQYAGLPGFDAYVCADDVESGKPAPDVFLKAAEKLSIPPEDCVVFEDAVLGLRAARNAGMKTVAVISGFISREFIEAESPDLIVGSISEVTFNKLEALFL